MSKKRSEEEIQQIQERIVSIQGEIGSFNERVFKLNTKIKKAFEKHDLFEQLEGQRERLKTEEEKYKLEQNTEQKNEIEKKIKNFTNLITRTEQTINSDPKISKLYEDLVNLQEKLDKSNQKLLSLQQQQQGGLLPSEEKIEKPGLEEAKKILSTFKVASETKDVLAGMLDKQRQKPVQQIEKTGLNEAQQTLANYTISNEAREAAARASGGGGSVKTLNKNKKPSLTQQNPQPEINTNQPQSELVEIEKYKNTYKLIIKGCEEGKEKALVTIEALQQDLIPLHRESERLEKKYMEVLDPESPEDITPEQQRQLDTLNPLMEECLKKIFKMEDSIEANEKLVESFTNRIADSQKKLDQLNVLYPEHKAENLQPEINTNQPTHQSIDIESGEQVMKGTADDIQRAATLEDQQKLLEQYEDRFNDLQQKNENIKKYFEETIQEIDAALEESPKKTELLDLFKQKVKDIDQISLLNQTLDSNDLTANQEILKQNLQAINQLENNHKDNVEFTEKLLSKTTNKQQTVQSNPDIAPLSPEPTPPQQATSMELTPESLQSVQMKIETLEQKEQEIFDKILELEDRQERRELNGNEQEEFKALNEELSKTANEKQELLILQQEIAPSQLSTEEKLRNLEQDLQDDIAVLMLKEFEIEGRLQKSQELDNLNEREVQEIEQLKVELLDCQKALEIAIQALDNIHNEQEAILRDETIKDLENRELEINNEIERIYENDMTPEKLNLADELEAELKEITRKKEDILLQEEFVANPGRDTTYNELDLPYEPEADDLFRFEDSYTATKTRTTQQRSSDTSSITEDIRNEVINEQINVLRDIIEDQIGSDKSGRAISEYSEQEFTEYLQDKDNKTTINQLLNDPEFKGILEKAEIAGYKNVYQKHQDEMSTVSWEPTDNNEVRTKPVIKDGTTLCELTEVTSHEALTIANSAGEEIEIKSHRIIEFDTHLYAGASGPLDISMAVKDKDGKNIAESKAVYFTAHYDNSGKLVEVSTPQPIKFLGSGNDAIGYIEHGGEIYTLPVTKGNYTEMIQEVQKNKGVGLDLSESVEKPVARAKDTFMGLSHESSKELRNIKETIGKSSREPGGNTKTPPTPPAPQDQSPRRY